MISETVSIVGLFGQVTSEAPAGKAYAAFLRPLMTEAIRKTDPDEELEESDYPVIEAVKPEEE